jgi:hypothetical protein
LGWLVFHYESNRGLFDPFRTSPTNSEEIQFNAFIGLVGPGDFSDALDDRCSTTAAPTCTTPNVNMSFNVRIRPSGP